MKVKTKAKAAARKKLTEVACETAPKAAEYERRRIEIETAKLKVAPWNPRGKVTPESVADLAGSIASLGMIQPVVAMMDKDGGATLIAGHRRIAAAKIAGLEKVSCDILVGVDEATAKRMTFIENLQRKDADPLLESELVGGLVKSGMTQGEIAAETGRGREWVARRLNLSKLSNSWRKRVKDGEEITTDCLEHVAAYPKEVQERLKSAKGYIDGRALRWCEIRSQFDRETCDLNVAKFKRLACKECPNNTGCSPDLFDWDRRVTAFGRCLNPKCYRHLTQLAIDKAKEDAMKDGLEIRELKEHPDYSVRLQDKRDHDHNTLYVWKDYNGETQMQWGQKPQAGSPGGEMTEEQKDERRKKIAANKARRKLAGWCGENLAGLIAERYSVDVQIVLAFQKVFDIGNSWCVFGTQTNTEDVARAFLLNPNAANPAPRTKWAELAASEIAAKVVKPEIGAKYAELLIAILPDAAKALTDEERHLVVTDEKLEKLREPLCVRWTECETDADADDAMQTEADEVEDEE